MRESIRHRLLPGSCVLCAARTAAAGLCRDCLQDLPHYHPGCYRCGEAAMPGHPCGRCQTRPPPFDRLVPAFYYQYPVDRLIHAFKYRQALLVARALAPALGQRLRQGITSWPERLVPVPLHRSRLVSRGYNQAHEIARLLGLELGLSLDAGLIRRCRATREQNRLDRRARRRNLRRAFALTRTPRYRSVAIVDDVVTTGTTVAELARLLRRAGVEEIQVWCLARASLA